MVRFIPDSIQGLSDLKGGHSFEYAVQTNVGWFFVAWELDDNALDGGRWVVYDTSFNRVSWWTGLRVSWYIRRYVAKIRRGLATTRKKEGDERTRNLLKSRGIHV